ncbi:MAG: 4Fe-4S dicluster domain-containing protein [Euryarchaeota archaeon]|nr:4Fe-4S dicluster domain-containing protein [Euryarchaeota archaeon]
MALEAPIRALLVAAILAVSLSVFGIRMAHLLRLMWRAKPTPIFNLHLFPWVVDVPERIRSLIVYGFLQKRMFKEWYGGVLHAFIFFGFLVLFATVVQFVGEGLVGPDFQLPLAAGDTPSRLIEPLALFVDLFIAFVFLGIAMAMFRRVVIRPKKLKGSFADGMIVLTLILTIVTTLALVTAIHILRQEFPASAAWTPVSRVLAGQIGRAGWSPELTGTVNEAAWWGHLLALFGFLAYLPFSKHFHVVTALPNVFFRSLEPRGRLRPMDFTVMGENDRYGASRVEDLTWKDILDSYGCTHCGRCESVCPAAGTGKPLSPKKIVVDVRENLTASSRDILAGGTGTRPALIGPEYITEDELWSCTTCLACVEECPVFIDQMGKIIEMRRHLVMMEGKMPAEAQGALRNLEVNQNPWAFNNEKRADWTEGLQVPLLKERGDATQLEVLYWVGCAASFDERNKAVARSLVKIFRAAGVNFAILGTEEKCNGDPARRMGNEFLGQTLIKANAETLNRYKVHTVVTACPHCFNTFKNEYPQFGFNARVIHHTEYIAELLQKGRLKLKADGQGKTTATYHDSCYLGRYNQIYEPQRDILKSLGFQLEEMKRSREKGFCCGAGGARFLMEERLGTRINQNRVQEAAETGAKILASACPYCLSMMEDGAKTTNLNEKLTPKDIAELVAERI